MKTLKDKVFDFLRENGIRYDETEFGAVFKFQMCHFLFITDDGDWHFLRLQFPRIYNVSSENRSAVLEAANRVNRKIKVAKCYIDDEDVDVVVEEIIGQSADVSEIIPRLFDIMILTRSEFYKALDD